MNKYIRIPIVLIIVLLGFIAPVIYLLSEVIVIAISENLKEYFTVFGVVYVLSSFVMLITSFRAIIFQIKQFRLHARKSDTDLLDNDFIHLKKIPKYLKNATLIFGYAFLVFGLNNLLLDLFETGMGIRKRPGTLGFSFVIIISSLIILYDAYEYREKLITD